MTPAQLTEILRLARQADPYVCVSQQVGLSNGELDELVDRLIWVPVEERMPAERELVLACLEDGTRLISSWFQWETMDHPLWHGFVPRANVA